MLSSKIEFTLTAAAVISFLALAADFAKADSITSQTSTGKGFSSEVFDYDGETESVKNSDEGLFWNLGLAYARSTITVPATKREIIDRTSTATGGLGWQENNLEFGGGLAYSSTPNERLHDRGPNLYLGYTFKKQDADDEFTPAFDIKGSYSRLRYAVDERNGRPSIDLNQSSHGIEAKWSAFRWASLLGSYTSYSYDRDVNRFLAFLDSGKAVRLGLARFASTVSGFPSHVAEILFTLKPIEAWKLEFDGARIVSQADGSITYARKVTLSHEIDKWEVGVGGEKDHSSSLDQKLLLINFSRDFD